MFSEGQDLSETEPGGVLRKAAETCCEAWHLNFCRCLFGTRISASGESPLNDPETDCRAIEIDYLVSLSVQVRAASSMLKDHENHELERARLPSI